LPPIRRAAAVGARTRRRAGRIAARIPPSLSDRCLSGRRRRRRFAQQTCRAVVHTPTAADYDRFSGCLI